MNFLLSDTQLQFQGILHALLGSTCTSAALHAALEPEATLDRTLWRKLCDAGVSGIHVPERHGGLGLELIDLALVSESLGYAGAPTPFLGHALASFAIAHGGSEEQKRRLLPALATGKTIATVALAESHDRWLPEDWTLKPGTKVSGAKVFAPNATEANIAIIGFHDGRVGLAELDQAAITRTRVDGIDRTRRIDLVQMQGAAVEMLPGAVGRPLTDVALVLLAADAFGGARRCVDMAVQYAKEREQFGHVIADFQAIRHQLANMALMTEPARGLYWYAAHAFDHIPKDASHAAALAKAHTAECFLRVARDNIEIHGGVGYTWEFDPHIWLKRAMFDWAWFGSPGRHRLRAADLAGW